MAIVAYKYSLNHRVLAGAEVISWAINEGNPEIKEQVNEEGPSILCEEYLTEQKQNVERQKEFTRKCFLEENWNTTHSHPADLCT